MPVIRDKIASQPASRWFASFNINTVQAEVSGYVNGANAAGQIPVLTIYGITNRDCGGASAGGEPDAGRGGEAGDDGGGQPPGAWGCGERGHGPSFRGETSVDGSAPNLTCRKCLGNRSRSLPSWGRRW